MQAIPAPPPKSPNLLHLPLPARLLAEPPALGGGVSAVPPGLTLLLRVQQLAAGALGADALLGEVWADQGVLLLALPGKKTEMLGSAATCPSRNPRGEREVSSTPQNLGTFGRFLAVGKAGGDAGRAGETPPDVISAPRRPGNPTPPWMLPSILPGARILALVGQHRAHTTLCHRSGTHPKPPQRTKGFATPGHRSKDAAPCFSARLLSHLNAHTAKTSSLPGSADAKILPGFGGKRTNPRAEKRGEGFAALNRGIAGLLPFEYPPK